MLNVEAPGTPSGQVQYCEKCGACMPVTAADNAEWEARAARIDAINKKVMELVKLPQGAIRN